MSFELIPGRYAIDASHSSITFSTRFVVARVRGAFPEFSGIVEVAEDLEKSTVQAEIVTTSLTTAVDARDEHLRSADYFDVASHPTATFVSTGLTADGERFELQGELTVRGVTRPISLDLHFLGSGEDHYGNARVGFRATTRVSRSAFDVAGNVSAPGGPLLMGDATDLVLEISAIREG